MTKVSERRIEIFFGSFMAGISVIIQGLIKKSQEFINLLLGVVDAEAYADHAGGLGTVAALIYPGLLIGNAHEPPYVRMCAESASACACSGVCKFGCKES